MSITPEQNPAARRLRDEFNNLQPLLARAPALLSVLNDARGAMSAMRDQIEQMRGMFPDEDGTIEEACEGHDDAERRIGRVVAGLSGPRRRRQ